MADKFTESYSTSLVISKMQIKPPVRYYHIPPARLKLVRLVTPSASEGGKQLERSYVARESLNW